MFRRDAASRRVCSLLAAASKSRPSDCSCQTERPLRYWNIRDPSIWTRFAPIDPDVGVKYFKHTEEYESWRLQAKASSDKKKTSNIFVVRLSLTSLSGPDILTEISFEDDGSLSPKYSIAIPFHDPYRGGSYQDSNGVFCHVVVDDVFVWNPITLEIRKLPSSPNTEFATDDDVKENAYSVCWADRDDYKVVRFYHYRKNSHFDGTYEGRVPDYPVEIEVYSLKTDSWKKMICCEKLTSNITPFLMDGVVYIIHRPHVSEGARIISLDIRSETFSTLPFPDVVRMHLYKLVEYNGELSIWAHNLYMHGYSGHWVMRNGEWVLLASYHASLGMPLGFARNGEVVLFQRCLWKPESHYVLMMFDSTTGELKQVPGFASRDELKLLKLDDQTFVKLKPSSGEQEEDEDYHRCLYAELTNLV